MRNVAAGKSGTWASVPVPLWIRLPLAVALVVWGARTDRRWTVPVASMLALPALWYGGLSMLLAVIPLLERRARRFPRVAAPATARSRGSSSGDDGAGPTIRPCAGHHARPAARRGAAGPLALPNRRGMGIARMGVASAVDAGRRWRADTRRSSTRDRSTGPRRFEALTRRSQPRITLARQLPACRSAVNRAQRSGRSESGQNSAAPPTPARRGRTRSATTTAPTRNTAAAAQNGRIGAGNGRRARRRSPGR